VLRLSRRCLLQSWALQPGRLRLPRRRLIMAVIRTDTDLLLLRATIRATDRLQGMGITAAIEWCRRLVDAPSVIYYISISSSSEPGPP